MENLDQSKILFKTINYKGKCYLSKEDVISMLLSFSDGEPIDTQERLDELARRIRDGIK